MKYNGRKAKNWVTIHKNGNISFYCLKGNLWFFGVSQIHDENIHDMPLKDRKRLINHIFKNKWNKVNSIWTKPFTFESTWGKERAESCTT